jgi:hypothetical protein
MKSTDTKQTPDNRKNFEDGWDRIFKKSQVSRDFENEKWVGTSEEECLEQSNQKAWEYAAKDSPVCPLRR